MNTPKDKTEEYEILKAENADRIHISFSEFSLFNQCGHKHLLEKHLGILQQPPSIHLYFGNAIHASLEQSLKKNLEINSMVDFFRETFTKDMMDNMKETTDFKNSFYDFLEQGENILRVLDVEIRLKDYEVVAIEEALYEKLFLKYFFKGFIDLVLRHKVTKRYKIVDWKTSGSNWDVNKKKKDETFLAQMRFYKFFWGRKNKIPLDEIDCGYIVLNRLSNKKDPKSYPGKIQEVDVISTSDEIKNSLEKLANTIKLIHVDKNFPKIKHTSNAFTACMFCPLKGGKHPLCDSSANQHKSLLKEHKKK